MTTTMHRPTTWPSPEPLRAIPAASSVGAAVLDASEAVVDLAWDDPRWYEVGPLLTSFVDAARRAVGLVGSPIGPADDVVPVLRLRDLARLSTITASSTGTSTATTPQVSSCLRSLQDAARREPSR